MKALEAHVRGVEKDGLVWGGSKLVAVGFGIKKLQINLVIEDDKVGLDDLQEELADGGEEYIQSSDIVSSSSSPSPSLHALANHHTGCYAKVVDLINFWFFPTFFDIGSEVFLRWFSPGFHLVFSKTNNRHDIMIDDD